MTVTALEANKEILKHQRKPKLNQLSGDSKLLKAQDGESGAAKHHNKSS